MLCLALLRKKCTPTLLLETYKIHITGQVQGVGFRPFVYRLAKEWDLCGEVTNDISGVHITLNGDHQVADLFLKKILEATPPMAKIESSRTEPTGHQNYSDFKIGESTDQGLKEVRLSPDFGLCEDCRQDLDDKKNRRHGYAFTTCTNCGPRYSIINGLPYDRPLTEMESFNMCPDCEREYDDPMDRRFYSQTNSCPTCAVELSLIEHGVPKNFNQKKILQQCTRALSQGQIVAVKGIGGYLLLCDAAKAKSIQTLRKRKHRPDKPFAVLYQNVDQIKKDFHVNETESQWLESSQAPIVLLHPKPYIPIALKDIAPKLDKVGVMLPYAPLLYLIVKDFARPLIATSGNVSGSPILYQEDQVLSELSAFADLILTHNRKIVLPQDDSVISCLSGLEHSIVLRRSRGFAPSYFGRLPADFPPDWLATGAHMKGSFALSAHGQAYISQYLGNMESYDAQFEMEKTYKHLSAVLDFEPKGIFTDLHPLYFSHQWVKRLAGQLNAPIHFIQHHKAHFAAVLQENDLLESKKPVLGVIWDGTGLGDDGQIWGGEFFGYQDQQFERLFHLREFPLLLADKMSREPRLSALALANDIDDAIPILKKKFNTKEWSLYQRMLNQAEQSTTSMGRLFDAAASLLGIIDKSTFEGQAAMYLEACASRGKTTDATPYRFETHNGQIDVQPMLQEITEDIRHQVPIEQIAYSFHLTLVEIIHRISKLSGITRIACSGGVFQNTLLEELIIDKLAPTYELYFHKELSPNDENISFGQLIYGYIAQRQGKAQSKLQHKLST